MRKLERELPGTSVRSHSSLEGWDDALAEFLRLHRLSKVGKARFMDERMESFFRDATHALAAAGCGRAHQPYRRGRGRMGRPSPHQPAVKGVRLHDLRHTVATLQLSAGVQFMQVSKWLGHSTFNLTLGVYGDYIPEQNGGALNTLPEPPAPASSTAPT